MMNSNSPTYADHDHHETDTGRPKRRKINLACEQCRVRKARCDGLKPICGNCTRRDEQCVYKITKAQGDITQDYVNSLLAKITTLEEENARLKETRSTSERDIVSTLLAGSSASLNPVVNSSPTSFNHPKGALAVTKTSSIVDAMGAASAFARSLKSGGSFFGSSSTSSLMDQVFKAIGENDHLDGADSAPLPVGIDNALFQADFAGPENFALFPRAVTDLLLNSYFDKVYPLYPIVHKQTFLQSYERLWHAKSVAPTPRNPELGLGESGCAGPLSFPFHCALNAMLILGAHHTNLEESERDTLVFQCLQKCKNLLKVDLLNAGSLAVLQMMLLLSHYFQSTTSPNKPWNTIGLSCRLAQSLGLHADTERSLERFEPVERELRKRCWYTCIAFDMLVSIAQGRPVMLRRKHAVPLPEATDDEYLLNGISQPENHFSDLAFYVETCKIFSVLRNALSSLYKDQSDGCSDPRGFDKTIELDQDLSRILENLPKPLDWREEPPNDLRVHMRILMRQRSVLHLRYLCVRVGIHRPSLMHFCRVQPASQMLDLDRSTGGLVHGLARFASVACIRAAIELAETVHLYAGTDATCEWWYNMFFIRLVTAIILIAKARKDLAAEVGDARLENAWYCCKDTLAHKLPSNELVRGCLLGLESMHDRVQKYTEALAAASADMTTTFEPLPPVSGFEYLDGGFFTDASMGFGFGNDGYTWSFPFN